MKCLSVEISESDFIKMDQYNLNWRFTDPMYNLLPKSDLEKIHPLCSQIIEKLLSVADKYIYRSSFIFKHESFHADLYKIEI